MEEEKFRGVEDISFEAVLDGRGDFRCALLLQRRRREQSEVMKAFCVGEGRFRAETGAKVARQLQETVLS